MPTPPNDLRTVPSVLSRLLDDDGDDVPGRDHSVATLKEVVGRDLEALLNTRREALDPLPPELTALGDSLLTYGLPDFTTVSMESPQERAEVVRSLEQTIETFEPRLDRVRVSLEEETGAHALRFRIEAVLRVDPAPEPVTFDAELQTLTQRYHVRGEE